MAESIEMPFRLWVPRGPRNHVLDGVQMPQWEGTILGERVPIVSTAMSCTKTAEAIDFPFWLQTRIGQLRKRKFSRISHVAPMCTRSIVFARWRQCTRRHCRELCENGGDQFAVCIADSGGPKEDKFSRIHQVAPMCRTTPCRELCKNGWTYQFGVWLVDLGGPKEAQVQSYSPGGANVLSWEGTLSQPGKYGWTVSLWRRCGLTSDYFDHLL